MMPSVTPHPVPHCSVEAFVLSYTALLTSAPGVTPTLLANLVNARAASDRNMTKADAREVGGLWVAGAVGWAALQHVQGVPWS